MGGSDYSYSRRSFKTASLSSKNDDGSYKVKTDDIFQSNKKHTAHESMIPNRNNKAHLREARDSEKHPNSTPIIIALDITGSMESIPDHLIREGLPKIVGRMAQLGVPDPAICIMAVGDSAVDGNNGVFQLGQFESGDVEMDLWLERIWISKKGGGNEGESYNWPYFYALHHVKTDAWEKRKQKGFIFTIGDERCLEQLTSTEIKEYMGEVATTTETVQTPKLVESVQEKWNTFHIDLSRGRDQYGKNINQSWKDMIGAQNVIECGRDDYDGLANKIAETVAAHVKLRPTPIASSEKNEDGTKPNEIIL